MSTNLLFQGRFTPGDQASGCEHAQSTQSSIDLPKVLSLYLSVASSLSIPDRICNGFIPY